MNQNMDSNHDDILYGVNCDVTNCQYNDQRCCCADEIKVGPQFANSCADTACATFKPR